MPVAIVGAGTMGADIAQTVALGGDEIILIDTNMAILRRALGRISRGIDQGVRRSKVTPVTARRAKRSFRLATDIDACAPADVVIEAVDEDRNLKRSLLQEFDEIVPASTILVTSTNTLSVTALAAATRRPERVIGLHFFNPAHIMRLVEVVRCDYTRQDVIDRALMLITKIGKTPVLVQDMPGLIVNRVALRYFGEALTLLDDTRLDAKTLDRLMEAAGFPMGPFRLMDFLDVEAVHAVTQALYEATFHDPRYRPHPRLPQMIQIGRRFYDSPA